MRERVQGVDLVTALKREQRQVRREMEKARTVGKDSVWKKFNRIFHKNVSALDILQTNLGIRQTDPL